MTARATGRRSSRIDGARPLASAVFAFVSSMSHAGCVDPSYLKLRPPKYPQAAITAKAEGRVLVQATVGVDGVPSDLLVQTSSGNTDLDQAALDSVAGWRFNPRTCDGKAVVGQVIAPVEFNLHAAMLEQDTAGALPDEDSPDPSTVIVTRDHRELAPDPRPIGAATAADLLKQLREDKSVRALKPREIDAATTLTVFIKPDERAVFDVVQSTEHGWNAVTGGGWISIIRTRFVSAPHATRELYAQRCDGDDDWCRSRQTSYLRSMRENPPPIPPPASPHPVVAN